MSNHIRSHVWHTLSRACTLYKQLCFCVLYCTALCRVLYCSYLSLLPVHSMPAPAGQLLYGTTLLFKVLYCKIKNVFFIFCVCVLCIICLTVLLQYCIASCVGWIPRLALLDLMNKVGLRTCSQNGIHLYIGDLL